MGIKYGSLIISAGEIRDAALDIMKTCTEDEKDVTVNLVLLMCAEIFENYFFGGNL